MLGGWKPRGRSTVEQGGVVGEKITSQVQNVDFRLVCRGEAARHCEEVIGKVSHGPVTGTE